VAFEELPVEPGLLQQALPFRAFSAAVAVGAKIWPEVRSLMPKLAPGNFVAPRASSDAIGEVGEFR